VDLTPGNEGKRWRGNSKENKAALYNKNAAGAGIDKDFESASQYFRTVWHNSDERRSPGRNERLNRIIEVQNSFGSTIPADGGFLIPEVLRSQLLELALEESIMRSRATVIPMESLRVPIPTVDDTSHASSVFGGIVCYWTEESAALTESQASFGRVVLDAKKLTALANVPNELINDASAFGGFVDRAFPAAMTWYEDKAFLMGSGVGEPLGAINCPASVQVTAEVGQPTGTIVVENLTKMYSRMLPGSLMRGIWVVSPDAWPQLMTMALSVGTGGAPVMLTNGGIADAPPLTIYGRPVYTSEKVPALGTTGDISFIDPSYYLIGDRQAMVSMSSPHYKFGNDQTSFRIIERVDGRPWIQSALTPSNGSATLTPFVQIASR
jgi:HK97 family phage major capsid protein